MIRALIFDFDGLIIDTERPELLAWQEEFTNHGVVLDIDAWIASIGKSPGADGYFDPLNELETALGGPIHRDDVEKRCDKRKLQLVNTEILLPGVYNYIVEAQRLGLRLGIASSSPRNWLLSNLDRLELTPYFHVVRGRDDVGGVPKPSPDVYFAVLEGIGIQARQAIALEDSRHGVTAAKVAGIFCVAVPNELTHRTPLDHADLRLNSLTELSLSDLVARVNLSRQSPRLVMDAI